MSAQIGTVGSIADTGCAVRKLSPTRSYLKQQVVRVKTFIHGHTHEVIVARQARRLGSWGHLGSSHGQIEGLC